MSNQPRHIDVSPADSLVGQVLAAGRLVCTLKSRLTGVHITLAFAAKVPGNARWKLAPLSEAHRLFVNVPSDGWSDKIGTYYPEHVDSRWAGQFYPERSADPARVWAAIKVLDIACGRAPMATEQYELVLSKHCLRCGAELTEPESIEAMMGPVCKDHVSAEYGKRHHVKAKRRVVREETARVMPRTPEPSPQPTVVLPPACTEPVTLSGDLKEALRGL